ncbi:MAG: response regulator [Helicobacteraceae bacterium]|nr:response regulator [Helicobacteraceae bacterium]
MTSLKELKNLCEKLSVLYVEDNLDIQRTMEQYLKKFFLEVVCASDGEEGLSKYNQRKFDVVVTDLSMPKMNGLEMIENIKKLNEDQSILITTAHSESNYMFSAIKAKVDGYVIKPFDYEQLNYELFKISEKIKTYNDNANYKFSLETIIEEKTAKLNETLNFQSDNYDQTIFSMVEMIEKRDTYTAGHSQRVAEYSKLIAQEMGYSKEECTLMYQAGILHDVGKIGTPDAVLLNPKNLNDIEYKLIQEHVSLSYKLLNTIPMFEQLSNIVYSHHERYDGRGYPRGLKADEITPLARIMIVADAFDAMSTTRIYKSRKSVKEALEELSVLSAKQFHPEVVKAAIKVLKNIHIDNTINQLPKTKLEEERFAYFYNDTVSDAYNQSFLDVTLMRNSVHLEYESLDLFYIHGLYEYNKEYSWKDGDKLLNSFANILLENLKDTLIFRIFGDDFAVLSKQGIELKYTKEVLNKFLKDYKINYKTFHIDLKESPIKDISQIEKL